MRDGHAGGAGGGNGAITPAAMCGVFTWALMKSSSSVIVLAPVKSSKLTGSPSLYIRSVGYARIMFWLQKAWLATQSTWARRAWPWKPSVGTW